MLYIKSNTSTEWELVSLNLTKQQAYHWGARYLMRGYKVSIRLPKI